MDLHHWTIARHRLPTDSNNYSGITPKHFGRGGSRTPMRLSPPFVSSEDLYHLGELFHHKQGGARGIRTPKGFTPTSFQNWLHNYSNIAPEMWAEKLGLEPRCPFGRHVSTVVQYHYATSPLKLVDACGIRTRIETTILVVTDKP